MKQFDVFLQACKDKDEDKVESLLEGLEAYQSDIWGDGEMHIGHTAPTHAREDIKPSLLTDPVTYFHAEYEVNDTSAFVTLRLGLEMMTGMITVFPNEQGKIVGLIAMKAELASKEDNDL